jgi:hypothetical protein
MVSFREFHRCISHSGAISCVISRSLEWFCTHQHQYFMSQTKRLWWCENYTMLKKWLCVFWQKVTKMSVKSFASSFRTEDKVLPCKWRRHIPQNGFCLPTSLHGITLLILILLFCTPTNRGSKTHYAIYWKAVSAKLYYIQRQSKARENSSLPWRLWSCTTLVYDIAL